MVAYGWDLFDKIQGGNKERMEWKEKMLEMMAHPSVNEMGRLSHADVAKLMKSSDVFAYPCQFEEIFCIAAAKAQAAGAIPVVGISDNCLRETVGIGIHISGGLKKENRDQFYGQGAPTYDEVLEKYKNELIKFLKDDKLRSEVREQAKKYARETFAWSKVAEKWIEQFSPIEQVIKPAEKKNMEEEAIVEPTETAVHEEIAATPEVPETTDAPAEEVAS